MFLLGNSDDGQEMTFPCVSFQTNPLQYRFPVSNRLSENLDTMLGTLEVLIDGFQSLSVGVEFFQFHLILKIGHAEHVMVFPQVCRTELLRRTETLDCRSWC